MQKSQCQKISNRLIVNSVSILVGAIFGMVINFELYFFHAVIVGWGDSAPDWYLQIQNNMINWIFLIAITIAMEPTGLNRRFAQTSEV